jgi:NAD+ synthase
MSISTVSPQSASTATSTGAEALRLDVAGETQRIVDALQRQVRTVLHRRGLVVAMSGGIDSSVCAALAARACGANHVLGMGLPERDSEEESLTLARNWAAELGIDFISEDITPMLDASNCYQARDAAIRAMIPEFGEGWRCKVVTLAAPFASDRLTVFDLVAESPDGTRVQVRIPPREYRAIVAATNMKQRLRATRAYYHADVHHYAVVSTPNRQEYDQGFFVKGGDGLGDVKPIAHLYKSQVYQLAEYLGVSKTIRERTPTTDTYSLPQTQEEFFFALPYAEFDQVLFGYNHAVPAETVGTWLGRPAEQIVRAYADIARKRRTTAYLHLAPLLVEPVAGVGAALAESF